MWNVRNVRRWTGFPDHTSEFSAGVRVLTLTLAVRPSTRFVHALRVAPTRHFIERPSCAYRSMHVVAECKDARIEGGTTRG